MGQKDNLDRFYTDPNIAQRCLGLLNLDLYDCIIEPSAGNGSFSNLLNCFAYDLCPAGPGIVEQDWFTLDLEQFKNYDRILVVGNPPFGQQNTLAIQFFNRAAEIADTIAFILPLSFKKISVYNKLDLNFTVGNEYILPKNSFTLDGKQYDIPTVFQVYNKGEKRKKIKYKRKSDYFDFVTKEEADFRIQRVGGNAGKASFDLDYSPQSNYFIKNKSVIPNEKFVSIVNDTTFPDIEYTVGPKSLSKGELIYCLEKHLSNYVDFMEKIYLV